MTTSLWIFVDDVNDAAQAFADTLSKDSGLKIEVMKPDEAKKLLLTGNTPPDGVLMDVDLSNAAGEIGTGPGIAQDIRIKQKAREVKEFPIVRFAAIGPVEKNIKGDPASDDLFDLKIQKESLARETQAVVSQLKGLVEIYTALKSASTDDPATTSSLLGIEQAKWTEVGHAGFTSRFLTSLQGSPHVAAGTILRDFLLPAGLVIGEELLAVRLGVDVSASGKAWNDLLESLPFQYSGIGSDHFPRWWSRSLESWWFEKLQDTRPLSSLTAKERVDLLQAKGLGKEVVPLQMPDGSAGTKPWRFCALMAEREPKEFLPIDPLESVRFMSRTDLPPWVDPLYAALGPALREKKDFRLNQSDLTRLSKKYK